MLLFLSGIAISACGNGQPGDGNISGINNVDPIFLEFYNLYGGAEVFGYPISSSYSTEQGKRNQYFETVLMSYDNIASSEEVFKSPDRPRGGHGTEGRAVPTRTSRSVSA